MIIDPPIKDLLEKVDCRYSLAVVVAKRARQIVNGSEPLVEADENKPVSIALKEINDDLITYRRIDNTEF
ncbi:MAG: DNA-directed RNA polymerase subunit omega [Christensenellales bacterium]|jgi:DNA-directed RNA polymerase subunit omega